MVADIKKITEKITAMRVIQCVVMLFIAMSLVFMLRTFVHTCKTCIENNRLASEIEHYRSMLDKDRRMLEKLEHREFVETYAREHYDMQRKDETVYVVRDK